MPVCSRPLISSFPFKPYRYYRVYSRKAQIDIMRAEILPALTTPPRLAFHARDGDHSAMVIARALPWDSDFFRVNMARIDYIMTSPDTPQAVVKAALDAALRALGRGGDSTPDGSCRRRRHPNRRSAAAARVPPHGRARHLSHASEEGASPRRCATFGVIRDFEPADADEVLDITRESFRGYVGRFQHDPHVPADRAAAFYLEWAQKGMSGKMADKRLVAVNSEGN